ncbi:MAG: hypothetical protein ACRDYC_05995, partial [Acidimicrobiales bacterium]
MDAALIGLGVVGTQAARQLLSSPGNALSVVHADPANAQQTLEILGPRLTVVVGGVHEIPTAEVVVLALSRDVRRYARAALERGAHVVCACDDPHEVRSLLGLDDAARRLGLSVVVGAAQAPGLSCMLALHASRHLDLVEEVHVARSAAGGPACARRYHAALSQPGLERYRGAWRRRSAGSGRELVWFPDPIGALDCYRANLVDPLLLAPAFPLARRITSRRSATRRDRFTA